MHVWYIRVISLPPAEGAITDAAGVCNERWNDAIIQFQVIAPSL